MADHNSKNSSRLSKKAREAIWALDGDQVIHLDRLEEIANCLTAASEENLGVERQRACGLLVQLIESFRRSKETVLQSKMIDAEDIPSIRDHFERIIENLHQFSDEHGINLAAIANDVHERQKRAFPEK